MGGRIPRILLGTLLAALAGGPSSAAEPPKPAPACTCAAARDTNGWCDAHHVGYLASIPVPSPLVYEMLDAHGHQLDLTGFNCASCKRAIATEGFCEGHRIGFFRELAYFSRLTYELARAELRNPSTIQCRTCRKNSESIGWCDRCKLGMAGHFEIRDRAAFAHVTVAVSRLRMANEQAETCERCAVALLTDTECPVHRITFKEGKRDKAFAAQ